MECRCSVGLASSLSLASTQCAYVASVALAFVIFCPGTAVGVVRKDWIRGKGLLLLIGSWKMWSPSLVKWHEVHGRTRSRDSFPIYKQSIDMLCTDFLPFHVKDSRSWRMSCQFLSIAPERNVQRKLFAHAQHFARDQWTRWLLVILTILLLPQCPVFEGLIFFHLAWFLGICFVLLVLRKTLKHAKAKQQACMMSHVSSSSASAGVHSFTGFLSTFMFVITTYL